MHNSNTNYTVDLRRGARRPADLDLSEVLIPTKSEKGSVLFQFLACMLLVALISAPFARVYASEGDVVTETLSEALPEVQVSTSQTTDVSESLPAEPFVVEGSPNEDAQNNEVVSSVEEVTDEAQNEVPEEVVDETDEGTVDEEVIEEEAEEGVVEETATETEEGEVLGETVDESEDVVAEEVVEEPVQDEPTLPSPVAYVPDPSQVVFSAKDCVTVSDGEFYCVKSKKDTTTASYAVSETVGSNAAFSQKDSEGDLEIYLNVDGGIKQITSNATDDDAPAYDTDTGRVAWHALVDDRYQIFVYDTKNQIARQLTRTEYNNTNPSIDGDLVTWQGWEDDNWEIFSAPLDSGTFSGGDISVSRISRNTEPDMFPKIYNRFITWQARVSDAWRTQGYNTVTGEQVDLGEGTGGDVSSARLVLLVERTNDSGDIERVGYEVETGAAIDLGSESSPVSEEPLPQTPVDGNAGSLPEVNANALKVVSRSTDGDSDAGSDEPEPELE